MDNVMEMLTIEIINDKEKNVLISCVYRPPGPGADLFSEKVFEMFEDVRSKSVIICGDFNIDLGSTNNFRHDMEMVGLCPMITQPTRITTYSATIIDNIYTNIFGEIISGIFVTDISDHLPVFTIYEKCYLNNLQKESPIIIRNKSTKALEAFREDLKKQNWDHVYTSDVNVAYNSFMSTLINLYDKNCKKTKICPHGEKNTFKNRWMTKGLKNACKKKTLL